MSSSEEVAYPILRKHDVDYVLIIFGGLIGYSGDDINKFLWMVRISQGIWPDEIQEPNYFTPQGEYRIDDQASSTMKNSLMYKMSYYRSAGHQHNGLALILTYLLDLRICLEALKLKTVFVIKCSLRSVPPWIILVCFPTIGLLSQLTGQFFRGGVYVGKLDRESIIIPAVLVNSDVSDRILGSNISSKKRGLAWTGS
jgi:hypothetical protein